MRIFYALSYTVGLANITGGVRRLLENYKTMARHCGYEVADLSPADTVTFRPGDLVHMAPATLEMVGLARELSLRNVPFVVSPIIDKVYSNTAVRLVSLLDTLFRRRFQTHLGAAQEMCRQAAGVALMSTHELERVQVGFGLPHQTMAVIKPYMLPGPPADPRLFQDYYGEEPFVLFVGDVSSPRKNVLRLVEATAAVGLPLVLIGSLKESTYGQRVQATIARQAHVHYAGVVSQPMLYAAMRSCRVLAMPSLVEGLGLAAVEAGLLGARIVVTKHGGPIDYLGPHAWYVEPNSVQSIAAGLEKAWQAVGDPPLRSHLEQTLSLNACAQTLSDFYQRTVAKRTALAPQSNS